MVAFRNGCGKVAPALLSVTEAFGFGLVGCERKTYAAIAPTKITMAKIAIANTFFNLFIPQIGE